MDAETLRALQAPLKQRYLEDGEQALIRLRASGRLGEGIACRVDTARGIQEAGLRVQPGGDGSQLCSGDMLLEALVACAGVTLNAVATALGIDLRDATVSAEGEIDSRGTLGISRDVPVGFRDLRLTFELDTDAPQASIDKLVQLTERYCVVLQTLRAAPAVAVTVTRGREP
ncbi:MAG TPA: OsmC family protein [Gammaproteobacteria bacterium]